MRRTLSLAAAATLLAVVACGDIPDPVSAPSGDLQRVVSPGPASQGWIPFDFGVVTCEETVDVAGRFHPLFHTVETSPGNFAFVGNLNAKGTGIGLSSGASYQWNDALPFTFKLASEAGAATTYHASGHTHLIGQAGATSWIVDYQITTVFSADGTLRVSIDRYEVRCG